MRFDVAPVDTSGGAGIFDIMESLASNKDVIDVNNVVSLSPSAENYDAHKIPVHEGGLG